MPDPAGPEPAVAVGAVAHHAARHGARRGHPGRRRLPAGRRGRAAAHRPGQGGRRPAPSTPRPASWRRGSRSSRSPGIISTGGPYLQVFGPDGQRGQVVVRARRRTSSSSLDATGELVPVVQLDASRFAVVTRKVVIPSGEYTLVAASPLEEVRRSVQTLASSLWLGIPLLVVLVGVVTWWLVGRALRPVERMRREVEEISHTTLHRRLDEPSTGDEIARLAHTMNDMLDRLEAAQPSSASFVSDASHELRSPLATIRTSVEVASLHPTAADWPGVAGTVLSESERLDELVADLLALAQLDETGDGAHLADRGADRPRRPRARRRGPAAGARARRCGPTACPRPGWRRRRTSWPGSCATCSTTRPATPRSLVTVTLDRGRRRRRAAGRRRRRRACRRTTASGCSSASPALDEGRSRPAGRCRARPVAGAGHRRTPTAGRSRSPSRASGGARFEVRLPLAAASRSARLRRAAR